MDPISINFTERLDVVVWGLTKLRNEIYVLCKSKYSSTSYAFCGPHSIPPVIRVFEDRIPFRQQKDIDITQIKTPSDIESNEKENCLYVSDTGENSYCIWKIRREGDEQHSIDKWMTIGDLPKDFSVSRDGQLLLVNYSSSVLTIYGSEAKLLLSVQLPSDVENPRHAVQTSTGNFIILHKWRAEGDKEESGSRGIDRRKWIVSELNRDGQTVIRRFIPSNEEQTLNNPVRLSLDSCGRVFVAVWGENRVSLLNSDLSWNRILCPTGKEPAGKTVTGPSNVYFDEEKKQLIVGGGGVNIYTLN